jgi:hypothetical protein
LVKFLRRKFTIFSYFKIISTFNFQIRFFPQFVRNAGSASVTYDLGSLTNIDRLALWNEESSGIGTLDLFHSSDGINFAPLALGLKPTDNPLANYPADVFSFASVNTRYIRFDMSDCPQPNPASFPSCAIGEVAFRKANVPEPASVLGLLAIGALGAGAALKRKLK